MATKKMPAKKVAAKKTSNVGSANAAEKRASDKRFMKKKVVDNYSPYGLYSSENYYSEGLDGPSRGAKKTGMDARKKDSKYGKPVGPTGVESSQSQNKNKISQKQYTTTVVKSAKGNLYYVDREKTKRRLLPDTNSKAEVSPVYKPKRTPTRTKTVRSMEGRAMNKAKTPTGRASVKKKYN